MKHNFLPLIFTFFLFHFTFSISHAQDPSAIADYESTSQAFIPILIEALKEQQKEIDELRLEMEELRSAVKNE